jgi:hypothetical protein
MIIVAVMLRTPRDLIEEIARTTKPERPMLVD